MRLTRRARALLAALLALLLGVGVAAPAGAETDVQRKKRIDAAIERIQADLSDTSRALADAVVALERAQLALPGAQQKVTQAETQLASAERRDQALAAHLALAQAEQDKATRQVADVTGQIEGEQNSIGALANATYRQGSLGQLAVALQADSPDDFADRLVLVQTVMRSGDEAVHKLDVAKADLRNVEATLAAKREQVAVVREQARAVVEEKRQLTAQARAARDEVSRLVATRAAAARKVAQEKAGESARLAQAQAESLQLADHIAAAIRLAQERASRGSGRVALVPSGALLFPANGPISQYAGYRLHPVTGSPSCHAGIDIAAGSGAPIQAAAGGVVVAATYTSWDGNVIVIDHGGGLTTWYAHQSSFAVSTGQSVSRGQVIGYVGSTGLATGPHLHFNVMVDGVLYDPLGWFGGPMRTVASMCPNGPTPVP